MSLYSYEAQSSVGIKRGQMTGLNASVFAGLNAQKQMDGMENSCKTIIWGQMYPCKNFTIGWPKARGGGQPDQKFPIFLDAFPLRENSTWWKTMWSCSKIWFVHNCTSNYLQCFHGIKFWFRCIWLKLNYHNERRTETEEKVFQFWVRYFQSRPVWS